MDSTEDWREEGGGQTQNVAVKIIPMTC
jgi:hypothetical protein